MNRQTHRQTKDPYMSKTQTELIGVIHFLDLFEMNVCDSIIGLQINETLPKNLSQYALL